MARFCRAECTTWCLILCIIRKYSAEENFLTVVENNSQEIRIRGFDPQHHRRRGSPVYSLELGVGELSRDGDAVLAGLPALVHLDLAIGGAPRESTVNDALPPQAQAGIQRPRRAGRVVLQRSRRCHAGWLHMESNNPDTLVHHEWHLQSFLARFLLIYMFRWNGLLLVYCKCWFYFSTSANLL